MPTELPRALIEVRYYQAAQEYLRNLPLEHFMEATPQATQREITLGSLALVRVQRTDFHLFNELLVQYPRKGQKRPGQVVPDNMVVIHDGPIKAEASYDTPLQPAAPFLVLDYVSKYNKRKDYEDNMDRYERELRVPYYLLFYPDTPDLTLYRHNKRQYVSVERNAEGRLAVPVLHLEVMLLRIWSTTTSRFQAHQCRSNREVVVDHILNGWVRYWYRGELLPLPADLHRELRAERQARLAAEQELECLRAELETIKRRKHK